MKYTGNIDRDLEVILPHIIADCVTSNRRYSEMLVDRARVIYANNPKWGQLIAKDNTKARDLLRAFMEHWFHSWEVSGFLKEVI